MPQMDRRWTVLGEYKNQQVNSKEALGCDALKGVFWGQHPTSKLTANKSFASKHYTIHDPVCALCTAPFRPDNNHNIVFTACSAKPPGAMLILVTPTYSTCCTWNTYVTSGALFWQTYACCLFLLKLVNHMIWRQIVFLESFPGKVSLRVLLCSFLPQRRYTR